MKMANKLLLIGIIFLCTVVSGTAFAADTVTISGTITEITTYPNMIAIDDGADVTEVYGIKFNYLERQYGILLDVGTEVSVKAYENLCYDGIVRLKASSITVDDATVDLSTTGSGRGRNRRP